MPDYTVWIEAEEWEPGAWDPTDDAADALVTLPDGSRWVATFCTYTYVETLRKKWASTGECLAGKYFWLSDLILIDELSRRSIEAVIQDLLATGEFESAFDRCPPETEDVTG